MEYTRPKSEVQLTADEKKELLANYLEFYEEQEKVDISRLNQKIPREVFEKVLNHIGVILLHQSADLSSNNPDIKEFLAETPLPSPFDEYLPTDFRVFCLLLNALKQWLSAEQAATDRYLLGGNARKLLKSISDYCIVTGEKVDGNGELHHSVRDGRPPIYISKSGHAQIEGQTKTKEIIGYNSNMGEEDISIIIRKIKKKYHHSWVQLRNACNYLLGNNVKFSTPNVKATSLQFAKRVNKNTGFGATEILDWMGRNNL